MTAGTFIEEPRLHHPCPRCGAGQDPRLPGAACPACGHAFPRALVAPYDGEWDLSDASVAEMKRYQALRLMGRFAGKDPDALRKVSHAEYLYLSRYPGFRFEWLAGFSRLETLELDYASMTGLEGIEVLKGSLSVLKLTECRKLRDARALQAMKGLKAVEISLCNKLNDLGPLKGLADLRRLIFSAKELTSMSFLEGLTELRFLSLPVGTLLEGKPDALLALKKLEELHIRSKLFPRPLAEEFSRRNPGCRVNVITRV